MSEPETDEYTRPWDQTTVLRVGIKRDQEANRQQIRNWLENWRGDRRLSS